MAAAEHGLTEEQLEELTPEEREGLLEEEEEEEEEEPEPEPKPGEEPEPKPGEEPEPNPEPEPKPGEEPEPKPEPEVQVAVRKPRGVINADLPEDFADRVAKVGTDMEALEKQYDDGDITWAEFRKQERTLQATQRELDRMQDRAEIAQESQITASHNSWDETLGAWLAQHPNLITSSVRHSAMNTFLLEETGPVMKAGGQPGLKEIEAAYVKFQKEFGITPTTEKPAKRTKKTTTTEVPPTLRNVPAAATTSVDDGKYAYLDRLMESDPDKYQDAFDKLSPTERDAYLEQP